MGLVNWRFKNGFQINFKKAGSSPSSSVGALRVLLTSIHGKMATCAATCTALFRPI